MQQQHFTLPDGQAVPAKHVPSAGMWWSRVSLRLLSIIFSIAIIGVSAFYYAHWTLGALIMMGPPVRQLGRVLVCPLLNILTGTRGISLGLCGHCLPLRA